MSTVTTQTPAHNPKNPAVDPLLAFVARAQARARLAADGEIGRDEAVYEIVGEAIIGGLLTSDEAFALIDIVWRLEGLAP